MRRISVISKWIVELKKRRTLSDTLIIFDKFVLDRIVYYQIAYLILLPLVILIIALFNGEIGLNYYLLSSFSNEFWISSVIFIGFSGFFMSTFRIICHYKYINKNSKKMIRLAIKNKTITILCLLLIWSIFSTFMSSNTHLSIWGTHYRKEGLVTYFSYMGIFMSVIIIKDRINYLSVIRAFVYVSIILSLITLFDSICLERAIFQGKKSSIFYNINHYGYYLCMSVVASLSLVFQSNLKRKNIFYIVLYSILLFTLLDNGSFGPYIAVITCLGLVTIFICNFKKNLVNKLIPVIIIFFIISFTMNLSTGFLKNEVIIFSKDVSTIVLQNGNASKAGSGRWEIWVSGLKFVIEKPIFGHGPDNLASRYLEEGIVQDRPHNVYIQIAASLGVPALCFYLTALFIHFKKIMDYRSKLTLLNLSINAILVTYLISSFFGNSMFYTTPYYLVFLGIAIGNIDNNIEVSIGN
jgi:O-antigen ligase